MNVFVPMNVFVVVHPCLVHPCQAPMNVVVFDSEFESARHRCASDSFRFGRTIG